VCIQLILKGIKGIKRVVIGKKTAENMSYTLKVSVLKEVLAIDGIMQPDEDE